MMNITKKSMSLIAGKSDYREDHVEVTAPVLIINKNEFNVCDIVDYKEQSNKPLWRSGNASHLYLPRIQLGNYHRRDSTYISVLMFYM